MRTALPTGRISACRWASVRNSVRKKPEDKKPESAELSLSIDNALLNETTLSTYRTNTVGLRSDGTAVAASSSENNRSNVTDWRDIRLPVTDRDTDNDVIEAGTL